MKTSTAPREAVIYLRVSTTCQAEEGVSLEAQEAKAREWAAREGFVVNYVFRDAGISGKATSNRPGLQNALDAVCRLKGALVVYSLSRLARSTRDALAISERLEKAGADLVSLSERLDTTTATGKMVFRLLAVLAEFERDLVAERTKSALAHLQSLGKRTGGVPYGRRLTGNGTEMEDVPEEALLVEGIRIRRANGEEWKSIADYLNDQGSLTKQGRLWTWRTVQAVAGRRGRS
jgi:site-specific DNA recombinase